jgi:hypothetical protein
LARFLPDSRIGVWVVGDFSENPQSFRAVASGQSGIVIFVIHCLPLSSEKVSTME